MASALIKSRIHSALRGGAFKRNFSASAHHDEARKFIINLPLFFRKNYFKSDCIFLRVINMLEKDLIYFTVIKVSHNELSCKGSLKNSILIFLLFLKKKNHVGLFFLFLFEFLIVILFFFLFIL